ncbi:FAD binding domain protein [Immersiella caudata]|uniref:FAD binding domain protein n=1 Tax=Immersiella caudata TaxID=314043 RepID=A0AA40BWY5_9PEZI|nr:FAD binding domain protein [Immersiella caudata]
MAIQLRPLIAILLFGAALTAAAPSPKCRCGPAEPCWPPEPAWNALNASIDGNLVAVRPFASVCHDPTYDLDACQIAKRMSNESLWLSANPGAVQSANWASLPQRNETCYIDTHKSLPCGQGRISLYSAVVRKTEQIQAAVRFAKKHNVRLAIKNTGHCFLGRSVAPDSLQILTHHLKEIAFVDDFRPTGSLNKSCGSAVTIGAGVQLKELYTALGKKNLTAVIGASHTVGAAGGYIQGGGHSPLGTWKGMAADNALEFEVVTAKGDLVTANSFQNPDLFFALRGGGGGSWGVVTRVTIRTFPDPPTAIQSLTISSVNSTAFWAFIEAFHVGLPSINDAGGSGYYFITPSLNVSTLSIALFFAGHQNGTIMASVLDPLINLANETFSPSSVVALRFQAPGFRHVIDQLLPGDSDTTGNIVRIGSRLVSHKFLSSRPGAAKLTSALQNISTHFPSAAMTGHVVSGGQVARNSNLGVAVNPAWRRTVTHLVSGVSWPATAAVEEQREKERGVTEVMVPMLAGLEPDMGAYLNEADAYERDFQKSFWGGNYGRLREIKRRWDPESVFIVRAGVGSEEWDAEGRCRLW